MQPPSLNRFLSPSGNRQRGLLQGGHYMRRGAIRSAKPLSRRPRRVEGTRGTSLYGDGTSEPVGSPGGPGLPSAPGRDCQFFKSQTGFLARPPSGDSSSSPSPPCQAENCAAPLRARGPTRPLRAGSEFQGGGAETAGAAAAAAGPGSAVARAAPPCGGPARIRPPPGRCSPRPRDEPGERGGPPAPPALRGAHLRGTRWRRPLSP